MMNEIENRKNILMSMGVSSYSAYKDAGGNEIPKMYLLIDNFNAFKELYLETYEAEFTKICRDGLSVGISVVMTNSSTNGIGYRFMSNFENHICLTCAETTEYSNMFDRCRMEPKNIPGRALVEISRALYEVQIFLAFEGEKEIERSNAMKQFVNDMNETMTVIKKQNQYLQFQKYLEENTLKMNMVKILAKNLYRLAWISEQLIRLWLTFGKIRKLLL